MLCRQVSTPAHSSNFSASATVLRAQIRLAREEGKQQPERVVWKPHSRGSTTSRKARGGRAPQAPAQATIRVFGGQSGGSVPGRLTHTGVTSSRCATMIQ
jgi:hypothetical protein